MGRKTTRRLKSHEGELQYEMREGRLAFLLYLRRRFEWGTTPKNPYDSLHSFERMAWQHGYDRAVVDFFAGRLKYYRRGLSWQCRFHSLNPMTSKEYKRLRESVGTQTDAAKLLKVKRETINRRENGQTVITQEAADAMEHLAHCRPPARKTAKGK